MITNTSTQRAAATRQVPPGDITGRKMQQLNAQTAEHEQARERLIRDLGEGHGFRYIQVPGYGLAVAPAELIDFLKKEYSR